VFGCVYECNCVYVCVSDCEIEIRRDIESVYILCVYGGCVYVCVSLCMCVAYREKE
jgi:hypothetical protein